MFFKAFKILLGIPLYTITLKDIENAFHESRELINDDFMRQYKEVSDGATTIHSTSRVLSVIYSQKRHDDSDCLSETVEVLLYQHTRRATRSALLVYKDGSPITWTYRPSNNPGQIHPDFQERGVRILQAAKDFSARGLSA